MPTATEAVTFSNIAATTAAFQLRGGRYGFTANATFGGGSVRLETLAGDGSTWVPVSSLTANGHVGLSLYPGSYRVAIATATAVYAILSRVPD
jgi:hypothetical protein